MHKLFKQKCLKIRISAKVFINKVQSLATVQWKFIREKLTNEIEFVCSIKSHAVWKLFADAAFFVSSSFQNFQHRRQINTVDQAPRKEEKKTISAFSNAFNLFVLYCMRAGNIWLYTSK